MVGSSRWGPSLTLMLMFLFVLKPLCFLSKVLLFLPEGMMLTLSACKCSGSPQYLPPRCTTPLGPGEQAVPLGRA